MNIADLLKERIITTKNPIVVGLDPDLRKIPACYKKVQDNNKNPLLSAAQAIFEFNRDIIDTVSPFVPAVKPQIAFYEKYGSYGVAAFEKTVAYAKEKGLVVITDAKRNDIGNTAKAYADAHLGTVETLDGTRVPTFDADFLTVTPFLGSASIEPFVSVCKDNNKGIFVLVKTSNSTSGEIQDVITKSGLTVSQSIAKYVDENAQSFVGKYGYSSIGAVVGATYPEEAATLRMLMPLSYLLVPGYGAQGGTARDILPCFNADGLGAVVNSSRGILYTHISDESRKQCTKEEYLNGVRTSVIKMQKEIYNALKSEYPKMIY